MFDFEREHYILQNVKIVFRDDYLKHFILLKPRACNWAGAATLRARR